MGNAGSSSSAAAPGATRRIPPRTSSATGARSPSVFRPGEPIELLGGLLVVVEPQGDAHFTAIRLAEDALRAAFGPGWDVRSQGPIALDGESEPEPDVAVVPGTARDYRDGHPTHAVLVVEVAESSLRRDREDKGSLYARAGIADYWIVNLVDQVLEVYREPGPDPVALFGWRYQSVATLDARGPLPLSLPKARGSRLPISATILGAIRTGAIRRLTSSGLRP